MKYKYVVTDDNGLIQPWICTMNESHDDFALELPGKPIRAGYAVVDSGRWSVYGVSTSLKLESDPRDAELLEEYM